MADSARLAISDSYFGGTLAWEGDGTDTALMTGIPYKTGKIVGTIASGNWKVYNSTSTGATDSGLYVNNVYFISDLGEEAYAAATTTDEWVGRSYAQKLTSDLDMSIASKGCLTKADLSTAVSALDAFDADSTLTPSNDGYPVFAGSVKQYTLTLDYADGTDEAVKTETFTSDIEETALPTPTRTGYEFVGWFDANDTQVTSIANGTAKDISLTAVWKKVFYTGEDAYAAVYDYDYYIEHNPDVAAAYGDDRAGVLAHFVDFGMKEGRPASASFDVVSYYNANADLRAAFGDDLVSYYNHYISNGKDEGRTTTGVDTLQNARTSLNGVDYSAVYDPYYYMDNNADVTAAYSKVTASGVLVSDAGVLAHFVDFGMKEGRLSSPDFDVNTYKANYVDLQNAFGNNTAAYYMHYITNGKAEGRVAK
jgi:uncharacterized repeat protein (TIGR02543 family)